MIFKGNFLYTPALGELTVREGEYLVVEGEKCAGFYRALPQEYAGQPVTDFGRALVLPAFCDLHLHAPQMVNRGVGYDQELLPWLETYTFPVEARYGDADFAEAAWKRFLNRMWANGTLRFSAFATIHKEAVWRLMELTERAGLSALIGKVNMDRNGSPQLQEESAQASADATVQWIKDTLDKFENVKPILTPRFTPSCSDELMEKLSEIQKRYHLPMQSHLSENFGEIAWVKELCPNTHFYGEAYSQFDLFGGDCPTIMAHCVHSSDEEIALMKKQGVYIAHCPQSNTNLASGISPARRYLDEGLHIGLGSDIAGGTSVSILRAMADAIQVSKLYWRLVDSSMKPLTVEEAFYMGTEGGGSFFGKVGSFKEGYEFDAVVLNDSTIPTPLKLSPKDRLERLIYLSDDRNITAKYVAGRKIL